MALPFISLDEAAAIAGVSLTTVKRWARAGVRRKNGTQAKLLAISVAGRDCTTEIALTDFVRENGIKRESKS